MESVRNPGQRTRYRVSGIKGTMSALGIKKYQKSIKRTKLGLEGGQVEIMPRVMDKPITHREKVCVDCNESHCERKTRCIKCQDAYQKKYISYSKPFYWR